MILRAIILWGMTMSKSFGFNYVGLFPTKSEGQKWLASDEMKYIAEKTKYWHKDITYPIDGRFMLDLDLYIYTPEPAKEISDIRQRVYSLVSFLLEYDLIYYRDQIRNISILKSYCDITHVISFFTLRRPKKYLKSYNYV